LDVGTGLALFGSAKLVEKLLGPTAEYLGENLQHWTKKRVENTKRIFEHCAAKLGSRITEPGAVPPRVLKGILQDGSFCDDELMAEYFGGVLASSRTEISRDDRGAAFAALVGRMTTYQIRTHFFFYTVVKQIFDGEAFQITRQIDRQQLETFVEVESYESAMELAEGEDFFVIMNHALFGLHKESLIEPSFSYGSYPDTDGQQGIKFMPSVLGVELLLWAHGLGNIFPSAFLFKDVKLISNTTIPITPGFKRTVPSPASSA
jgi:hypothetical protein